MEQRSPSNPTTRKMVHTEFSALKTRRSIHLSFLVGNPPRWVNQWNHLPRTLCRLPGVIVWRGTGLTTGCWEGYSGIVWNLLCQVLSRLWECTRLTGHLGGGTKVRKVWHQGRFGRNKQVKIEAKGDKSSWLCVNRLLAWLSAVLHHHSLINILVKSYL